jgi:UPF0271 protein
MGEGFGRYRLGADEALLAVVSSANVACGFHAGDPSQMRRTVALARNRGVSVGAHPGYPDLVGFGRREMKVDPSEVEDLVVYQVGAMAGVARAEGVELTHVKPHGALYNQAARDKSLARAVARAIKSVDPHLALVGLFGSELGAVGREEGLRVVEEVFADRAYLSDGRLAPRELPGALVTEPPIVAERALRMIREGRVSAIDGGCIRVRADTICIHGDTAGAPALAAAVRTRLEAAGVRIVGLQRKSETAP